MNTFRKLGLTLSIDGSQDYQLSVKGIESTLLKIGNRHWDSLGLKGIGGGSAVADMGEGLGILEDFTEGQALNSSEDADNMAIEFVDGD